MPRLARAGSRCHSKSNTLRQQQQQLADILVQVAPDNYVACCRVADGGGCAAWIHIFGACTNFYFLASAASFSSCDMCLRFRGCPVVLDIELFVSARHQKTRVPLSVAVCGTDFKITCNESEAK